MAPRQPRHEPRAVEVRIDLELEVDLRPFRRQAERVVDVRTVADHRAEHHLVIAALRPSDPARHPGVDEHRDAFVIPPRRGGSRGREVEVEDRLRLLGDRVDLAAKQPPEEPVAPGRLVHRRDVNQLVVHDGRHPLVGGERFEGEAQRRDLHHQRVARHDARSGISGIRQIEQQHRHLVFGLESEQFLLEGHGVQVRARDVRRQVGLAALEVDEAQIADLDLPELGGRRHRDEDERKTEDRTDEGRAVSDCVYRLRGSSSVHANLRRVDWRSGRDVTSGSRQMYMKRPRRSALESPGSLRARVESGGLTSPGAPKPAPSSGAPH